MMDYFDLDRHEPDPALLRWLPEHHAREYGAIILGRRDTGPGLRIGMCDPDNVIACDRIAQFLQQDLEVVRVDGEALYALFDRCYEQPNPIINHARQLLHDLEVDSGWQRGAASQPLDTGASGDAPLGRAVWPAADAQARDRTATVTLAETLARTGTQTLGGSEDVPSEGTDSDPPVARLLRALLEEAHGQLASDLHIEPGERALRVRMRIDGALREQAIGDARIGPALISHLKLLSGLDIAERRLPQDGHFPFRIAQRLLDVRVATIPLATGEAAVLRLLDQQGNLQDFSTLGMPERICKRLRACLRRVDGLILITGPTGSGKTTTVYSAITELNHPERKIVTAEDPIEYCLPGINQVQVQPLIGLDFARVLRALLRHDPDVVAIGEIRDQETAAIGLRAAMTGHLVLSTLHTRDALSAVSRLTDLGCEGFLIADTLRAVIAQRLLRRVCPHCASSQAPGAEATAWLQAHGLGTLPANARFRSGSGCAHCKHTGYLGRVGVYELFEPDERVREHLQRGDLRGALEAARACAGYRPFTEEAVVLARRGLTTLSEVMRVAQDAAGSSA